MFKASLMIIYTMFKNQSEFSFLKQREELKTVVKRVTSLMITKTLKIVLSDLFKRERSKLKTFLLQIKMNIHFNELQFKSDINKVLYAVIYLRDYTAKWFQSVLTDFLKQKVKNQDNNIVKIFTFF